MELISRDEVMRLAESGKLLSGSFGERAKDIINSLPTIDERKEGEWINEKWTDDSRLMTDIALIVLIVFVIICGVGGE